MIIISAFQAKPLLMLANDQKAKVSLDLGISDSEVYLESGRFHFPTGETLEKSKLRRVLKDDTSCFFIRKDSIEKVAIFSEETQRYYKLVPTGVRNPPTLEISGIRMHVTKDLSPREDTEKKISFVSPCLGKVLDTCTGLGYTAIEAAKTAEEVRTYEIEESIIKMQKLNPWSRGLFGNKKIILHQGDIFNEIKKLGNESFDRIIHDPPRLTLAPLLYSQQFYNEMFRVLKRGGRVYHYTGNPGSKKRKLDIRVGVEKRLRSSGFRNIKRVFNGIAAEKAY